MAWALVQVTAPAEEPVSVPEAKLHLRVDGDQEDQWIASVIAVAREHAETMLGRSLVEQTWRLSLDRFPPGRVIRLPRPPLQAVTSVTYTAPDGSQHVLDEALYDVDTASEPGRIVLRPGASWPETATKPGAVQIVYAAGYGAAANVPEVFKHAILLLVGHWYEHREQVVVGSNAATLPFAVEALLRPHRIFAFDPAGEAV